MAFHKLTYSGNRSSLALLASEDNNSLFITRKNSLFAGDSESKMVSDDYYLLLIVYVHYFCAPVFTLILNVSSRYEKSVLDVCNENACVYSSDNISSMEEKDYLSILSFFLKEQIELNLIYRHQFCKTVLL